MAYIGGNENEFRGFGGMFDSPVGDMSEFMKQSCALNPSQPGCKAHFDKLLAPVRAASKAAVRKLEGNPFYGPVLAQALDGAKDPEAIAKRAQELAAKFSSVPLERSAYQFFYSQAQTGFELADQYLSAYPQAKALGTSIRQISGQASEGFSLFQKYEKTGLDAAGVSDVMTLMKKSMGTAKSLADAFGIAPEGSTMDEVLDWAGVAVGCGAAISTGAAGGPGIIGGAFSCAVSVLAKVFGSKVKKPEPSADITIYARFTPAGSQRGLIAADAIRLASLLKYSYGYSSWKSLIDRVDMSKPGWNMIKNYPSFSSGKAVGFTPEQSMQLFGGSSQDMVGTDIVPMDLLGATGGDLRVSELVLAARVLSKNPAEYSPIYSKVRGTFVWTELVTFFAATTVRELGIDPRSYLAPWRDGLPVRFYFTSKAGPQRFVKEIPGALRYSDLYWSNVASNPQLHNLLDQVSRKNPKALYELGMLRLLAALSYLQMVYEWGRAQAGSGLDSLRMGQDVIASLDDLNSQDPATALRIPVSPHRASWGGAIPSIQEVLNSIGARASTMNRVASVARTQAKNDFKVFVAAGAFKRAMLLEHHATPTTSGMMAASGDIGAQVAARGGFQLMPGVEFVPGKGIISTPYIHGDVPGGDGGQQKKSGVGTVVLIGAAALLALKFLK